MKICEKSSCSFENWFPKLRKWSIKAEYELIPDDVLEFLKSDGVTIPVEAILRRKKTSSIDDVTYKEWDSDDEGDTDNELPQYTFPSFSNKLSECLKRFGGNVFIKLNWSAPTDAAWIATNSSLKCSNLQDIYLLLKSSGKITADLDARCNGPQQFYLVFKEWQDIHPASEFRCFVSGNELIAISQRNCSDFHDDVPRNINDIVGTVKDFFNTKVKNALVLSNYTIDIVWTPASIKIIDINTFGADVDSCLFSWDELMNMKYVEGVSPEFRYISEDIGIQPARLSQYFGLPVDLTEISQEDSQNAIDILQAQVEAQRLTE